MGKKSKKAQKPVSGGATAPAAAATPTAHADDDVEEAVPMTLPQNWNFHNVGIPAGFFFGGSNFGEYDDDEEEYDEELDEDDLEEISQHYGRGGGGDILELLRELGHASMGEPFTVIEEGDEDGHGKKFNDKKKANTNRQQQSSDVPNLEPISDEEATQPTNSTPGKNANKNAKKKQKKKQKQQNQPGNQPKQEQAQEQSQVQPPKQSSGSAQDSKLKQLEEKLEKLTRTVDILNDRVDSLERENKDLRGRMYANTVD